MKKTESKKVDSYIIFLRPFKQNSYLTFICASYHCSVEITVNDDMLFIYLELFKYIEHEGAQTTYTNRFKIHNMKKQIEHLFLMENMKYVG